MCEVKDPKIDISEPKLHNPYILNYFEKIIIEKIYALEMYI